ncbi:MAG: sugar phosphate nucleotidyltransferase [Deltaproteobacteria bacterium]
MPGIKAVIPAAGFGTRLRPFTLAAPKEILPAGRKPMIHWAVEEAFSSGITEVGIVIRRGKEVIQEYFSALANSPYPLQEALNKYLTSGHLHFIYQDQPLGLGHALYESRAFLKDFAFVMIIPDQFLLSKVPATKQLLEASAASRQSVWSTVVTVPQGEKTLFPGARAFLLRNLQNRIGEVIGIQEEPPKCKEDQPVGFGRTYFPAGVLEFFSTAYLNPATSEVDLLFTFQALLNAYKNYAFWLEGRAMDLGTWEGYEYFFPKFDQWRP